VGLSRNCFTEFKGDSDMTDPKVPLDIAGTAFSDYEFEWDWPTTQLLARATG
jgi:hypothetical protein